MAIWNFGTKVIKAGGLRFEDTYQLGIRVINKSGSSIAANKLVAVLGFDVTSLRPKIVLADADVAAHQDIYVAPAAIANGAEGIVYKGGASRAVLNTNGVTAVGDPVYLDATTAGGFTATAPTAGNARVLPVGWVGVKSSTVGKVFWYIQPVQKISSDDAQAKNPVIVNTTSGAYAPTLATLNNAVLVLDSGTAITTTLPAPVVGAKFTVTVKQNAAHSFTTDVGTTFLRGTVTQGQEATTPAVNVGPYMFTANGTSHTVMTLGTTKGGLIGSRFTFECVAATCWQVSGVSVGSGNQATPFS